uniref:K Homology domain-containing protein n=1 Tax=Romanomermis culicivorax TaxID=13658 RepID=A0A915KEJ2_ROMCU
MANCQVVMPGDIVSIDEKYGKTVIGPGIKIKRQNDGDDNKSNYSARFTRCGILKNEHLSNNSQKPDKSKNVNKSVQATTTSAVWINYRQKRYIPVKSDLVIGQIVQKGGCADLAILSALSFDNATKKNKPNIKIGDLIYGRLVQDIEPELTCIGSDTGRVPRCLGLLPQDGFLQRLNLNVAYKLKSKDFPLLKEIGKELPYEICVGDNGWIWAKASNVRETVTLSKMVENCEYLSKNDVRTY